MPYSDTNLNALLSATNVDGLAGKAYAIDNLHLALPLVAPQTFELGTLGAGPVQVSDGVPAAGAGRIETLASEDDYHFTLVTAGSVMFRESDCGGLDRKIVTDDARQAIVMQAAGFCGDRIVALPAGSYSYDVTMPGATDSYRLLVQRVPDPQTFDLGSLAPSLTLNSTIGDGAGELETPTSEDQCRFSLPDDRRLVVAANNDRAEADLPWKIVTDDASQTTVVNSQALTDGVVPRLVAGSYRLVVGNDQSFGTAGSYQLVLSSAAPQTFDLGPLDDTAIQISDGIPAAGAGRIETLASEDDYRFSLATSATVTFSETGCGGLDRQIVAEDGSDRVLLDAHGFCGTRSVPLTAGSYSYRVTMPGTTDTYNLRIQEVPAPQLFDLGALTVSTSIATDNPAAGAGNLETTGSEDHYRFSTTGTQTINLDFTGSDPATAEDWRVVSGSDATTIQAAGTGSTTVPTLPAGDHELIVGNRDQALAPGSYRLTLSIPQFQTFDLGVITGTPTTVSDGVPAAGAGRIETLGSEDDYRFSLATSGTVAVTESGCGGLDRWVVRDDGSNTVLFRADGGCGSHVIDLPSGDYRYVVIMPGTTDSYSLAFVRRPDAQTFDLGDLASSQTIRDGDPAPGAGDLEQPYAEDHYTFSTSQVENVRVDLTVASGASAPRVQLIADATQTVLTPTPDGQIYQELPAGTYHLNVGDHDVPNNPTTYQLHITVAAPQLFDLGVLGSDPIQISDGSPTAGAGRIETLASEDDYRFTLDAPAIVRFEESACGGLDRQITRSDGALLLNQAGSCASRTFNLDAGTYDYKVTMPNTTDLYQLRILIVPSS